MTACGIAAASSAAKVSLSLIAYYRISAYASSRQSTKQEIDKFTMSFNDQSQFDGASKDSIETTLSKLEQILHRMESEEQPLEASLADFEEGIRLTRQAQKCSRKQSRKYSY